MFHLAFMEHSSGVSVDGEIPSPRICDVCRVFVPKLLSNMTYPHCAGVTIVGVLALFLHWIITIGNSSSASTKNCQQRHLFPRLKKANTYYSMTMFVFITTSEIYTITSVDSWGDFTVVLQHNLFARVRISLFCLLIYFLLYFIFAGVFVFSMWTTVLYGLWHLHSRLTSQLSRMYSFPTGGGLGLNFVAMLLHRDY